MNQWINKGFHLLLSAGLCLSAAGLPIPVLAEETDEVLNLYVSTDGNDENAGDLEHPLASLEEARDRIRESKENGTLPEGGAVVNLREGIYQRLDVSFTLTAEDSGLDSAPIIYQSYPGERAVLDGSVNLDGSQFEAVSDQDILDRLNDKARSSILVYDLKENAGIEEIAPIQKNGFGWLVQTPSASLKIDGDNQTLARYPNTGDLAINTVYSAGFVNRDHYARADGSCDKCSRDNGGTPIRCRYSLEEKMNMEGGIWNVNGLQDKYDLWSQESDIWTQGYFSWAYAEDNCHIEKVEKDGNALKFTADQPSNYGVGKGNTKRFFAYNLLCEIDEPGEYYIDRDNLKLYLYPPKDLSSSSISLSVMSKPMVEMHDTDWVEFRNLDFVSSNSHGIKMVDSDNNKVLGCNFNGLGQLAVQVGEKVEGGLMFVTINEGSHGGWNNLIESCNITGTGQGGIYLAGGNRYTLTDSGHVVRNCYFDDYSVINRTYCPAVWLYGTGSTIENCQITNAPHMAIQIDGNNHVIRGNDISNVCYETSDAGAIYTGRTWSFRETVIENNYIHDMRSNSGVGSAGIYVDDMGCGIISRNNLFANMSGRAFLIGGGMDNEITQNVILDSSIGINYDNRASGWAVGHITGPYGQCYMEWKTLKEDPKLDQNIWKNAYPSLWNLDLSLDGSNVCSAGKNASGAVIEDNVFIGVNNPTGEVNGTVKNLGTFANNSTYSKGTNPGFVDPDTLDYHIVEGSELDQKLDENCFNQDKCGLYVDEYRTTLNGKISTPKLLEPANQAENVSVSAGTTLRWNAQKDASRYLVEVASDADFTEMVYSGSVKTNSVIVDDLDLNTEYFWRVSAFENRLTVQ